MKDIKEQQFIERIKENGQYDKIIIKSDFINFSTKVLCQCKKHSNYEWWVTPSHLIENRGCPVCGQEKRIQSRKISSIDFMKRFEKEGKSEEFEILDEFKGFTAGRKQGLKCKCKKEGHIFFMNPEVILRGSSCPICAKQIRL